uniref:Arabinanase levansucrase invertase n=1 Tax=Tetraselmis sp. GSL018 TaxID=582737 RepID=A0A061SMX0_9CHLO|eukprot:CAMPEP_0177579514 /NCGR_PEP_ID=MMETSP0419_2-20121207/1006_1 /TAXON_ID=582737 /ORGANISM="Tetraselmis sp., Strain GSL018" /LENGTH=396 /DNA_ID=CAMNT_0019068197 /DNA_START=21 /DNA_END=1211 /DNA_ORIENTATION=-
MPLTFWKGFLETYVCERRKSSLLNLKAKFSLQSLFLLSLVSTCMQAVTDKNTGWKGVRPGTLWTDTSGEMIQAHGGGVLYFNHTYYWYGENKAGPTYQPDDRYPSRVDYIGINCYSSQDLIHWHSHGVVLGHSADTASDLHPSRVVERPKVVYHEDSRTFVMWMHIDSSKYDEARIGIAVSAVPHGGFQYKGSFRPHGSESRDMTVFLDDDGQAFLLYSSENNMVLHVARLNSSFTGVEPSYGRILINQQREAPTVFKNAGLYFILSSGCTGWWPNAAEVHVSESIFGPWHSIGNPVKSSNVADRRTTFGSQGTFVLPLDPWQGRFLFMADRWNESHLGHSRYVWLPLQVTLPPESHGLLENSGSSEKMKWISVALKWSSEWFPVQESHAVVHDEL